jgi:hypothetical protein
LLESPVLALPLPMSAWVEQRVLALPLPMSAPLTLVAKRQGRELPAQASLRTCDSGVSVRSTNYPYSYPFWIQTKYSVRAVRRGGPTEKRKRETFDLRLEGKLKRGVY